MNRAAGIVSQALSGRSLPVIQWMGASKCVPVCSPIRIVFQYHAGPLSSYFEMTSIVTPGDGANIGGRPITGVEGPSGCVRSTTFSVPRFSSSTSWVNTLLMTSPASMSVAAIHRLNRKAFSGKLQVHAVVIRADGRDLRHDHAQIVSRERVDGRFAEGHHRIDRGDVLDAGASRNGREIGDARRGVRVEATGREQAAVVENDVHEIRAAGSAPASPACRGSSAPSRRRRARRPSRAADAAPVRGRSTRPAPSRAAGRRSSPGARDRRAPARTRP